MDPREALTREALRLHQRYQRELVERFSVCPWARPARTEGRVHAHVVADASCSPDDLGAVIAKWAADDTVDVAFVILPRFDAGADACAERAAEVGDASDGVFLTASFHPDAGPDAGMIHFLRQTPDPTIQLVRRKTLEEIRTQDPPHYQDIFELDLRDLEAKKTPRTTAASVLAHNERTFERKGRAALQAIVDDIKADRERTYAKLIPLL